MAHPTKAAPEINCKNCGKIMERTRINGRLEDLSAFKKRKYCNRACMAMAYEGVIKTESSRSGHRQSKKMVKKCCEVCGKDHHLHVHHVDENPLNNSIINLMTLCAKCHRQAHSPNFSAPMERIICKYCDKPAMNKGLCWTHNTRYQKYGNPLMTKIKRGSKYILITEPG